MPLSNYAKSLGMKSKKEVLAYAPKDAEWSDLEGGRFYKVVDEKVLMSSPALPEWSASNHEVDHLDESYFLRLRKPPSAAAASPAPSPAPSAGARPGMRGK